MRRGFRKTLYTTQDVEIEIETEFENLLEIIQNCNEEEKAEIRGIVAAKKSYRKSIRTKQYVDCEYEVEFDDLLELISDCSKSERKLLQEIVLDIDQIIECKTIYDEEKMSVLKKAFDKYELDELIDRLEK
jgi:formate-dependent nitrite reductase cytochrome c552 subunit